MVPDGFSVHKRSEHGFKVVSALRKAGTERRGQERSGCPRRSGRKQGPPGPSESTPSVSELPELSRFLGISLSRLL